MLNNFNIEEILYQSTFSSGSGTLIHVLNILEFRL